MPRLRYLVFIFLCTTALLVAAGLYCSIQLRAAGPHALDTAVMIPRGSSVRQIANALETEGVITRKPVFLAAARLQHGTGYMRAGEYMVPARASVLEIIDLLKNGKPLQRSITLAEGLTSSQIVTLLRAETMLQGEIETVPPEGSLLPDTYHFTRGDSRQDILRRMQQAMDRLRDSLWAQRGADAVLKTPQDMVTLAAIVEKETGVAQERARVAGVFFNRLEKGMPLQSDPTVIYALTQGTGALGRRLLRKDLQNTDSPYNTYKYAGLPPGPITNPGAGALLAVAHPEKHDFYYFVADGTGGHVFAKTLSAHNSNVARWREIRKNKEKANP